jgi:hypothetical protein
MFQIRNSAKSGHGIHGGAKPAYLRPSAGIHATTVQLQEGACLYNLPGGVTEQCPQLIESIVIVDLDDDDKIVRLVDQWGGKELPTRFGALYLRRMSAMITPWIVRVPR